MLLRLNARTNGANQHGPSVHESSARGAFQAGDVAEQALGEVLRDQLRACREYPQRMSGSLSGKRERRGEERFLFYCYSRFLACRVLTTLCSLVAFLFRRGRHGGIEIETAVYFLQ